MNRHGISQNPTAEEAALLRKLWDGDNARARANRLRHENAMLERENARLRAEHQRLKDVIDSIQDAAQREAAG